MIFLIDACDNNDDSNSIMHFVTLDKCCIVISTAIIIACVYFFVSASSHFIFIFYPMSLICYDFNTLLRGDFVSMKSNTIVCSNNFDDDDTEFDLKKKSRL